MRSVRNRASAIIPDSAGKQDVDGVDRVEQEVLVLLQILVVGQRQLRQQPLQSDVVGDDPTRPWLARVRPRPGFFFCGSIDEPDVNASESSTKPISSLAHRTSSSPRRESARTAWPRHAGSPPAHPAIATLSRLLGVGRVNPRSSAVWSGDRSGIRRPTAPPTQVGIRPATRRAPDRSAAGRGSASARRPAGDAPAAPAARAADACSRAGACRGAARPGPSRTPASPRAQRPLCDRRHRAGTAATSVATWSLRLRPVCSRRPGSPTSSVSRRSTAVWMSSSEGRTMNVPSRNSASTRASPSAIWRPSSSESTPLEHEHPGVRARSRDVLRPHARVHRKRRVQPVKRLRRSAGEPPAPQPGAVAHRTTAAGSRVSTVASAAQTWSTWSSVISGKNGSAIVDALIASVTGSVPGR